MHAYMHADIHMQTQKQSEMRNRSPPPTQLACCIHFTHTLHPTIGLSRSDFLLYLPVILKGRPFTSPNPFFFSWRCQAMNPKLSLYKADAPLPNPPPPSILYPPNNNQLSKTQTQHNNDYSIYHPVSEVHSSLCTWKVPISCHGYHPLICLI